MYLAMGKYPEAIEAYEANLKKRPGRLNSIYGVALAAKKSGDNLRARNYFQQLHDLGSSGNSSRTELKEAELFLRNLN